MLPNVPAGCKPAQQVCGVGSVATEARELCVSGCRIGGATLGHRGQGAHTACDKALICILVFERIYSQSYLQLLYSFQRELFRIGSGSTFGTDCWVFIEKCDCHSGLDESIENA